MAEATLGMFPEPPGRSAAPLTQVTGVLPYQAINAMRREHEIVARQEILADQVQPASLDLRLGPMAWRVRASFLPGPGATVMEKIRQLDGYEVDISAGAVLEKGCVYVVELLEALRLRKSVNALANPKSSTGRLDVLTRLITDHASTFDRVAQGYEGPLYAEIAPRTFSVVVRPGSRLNQIRFRRGFSRPAMSELQRLHDQGKLVRGGEDGKGLKSDDHVGVTVDLKGRGRDSVIGYRAKLHSDRIDMDKVDFYDALEFWEPMYHLRDPALILNPNDFYILASHEKVQVPPDLAAEMVAYDANIGEFRVHYAGFFDPGFGCNEAAGGSRAVLEVRSHEVPFMLEHGQTVGWLRYERMAGRPDRLYGPSIGSNYQNQGLALAKQFRALPGA